MYRQCQYSLMHKSDKSTPRDTLLGIFNPLFQANLDETHANLQMEVSFWLVLNTLVRFLYRDHFPFLQIQQRAKCRSR